MIINRLSRLAQVYQSLVSRFVQHLQEFRFRQLRNQHLRQHAIQALGRPWHITILFGDELLPSVDVLSLAVQC